MSDTREKSSVLPAKYGAGPLGLGDPEDKSLRKVETEVMIPKKMRDIAKTEKCTLEVQNFSECCKDNSILMVFACRKENAALKECLGRWYQDEEFKSRCRDEYLKERSEYRLTGVNKNKKTARLPNSM